MAETILIVDDEDSVRTTFREWLESADLGCVILSAADAATALTIANERTIDLAILDWNLGAGNNGLQLLEDLYLFNPDVVAIMITGFAHQATPLDAMRMGVRDYLDKNQDLHRDTFLAAVRKQLDILRPAKRERELHRSLVAFRDAVEKVLPLVSMTAAMNDPVPLTDSIRQLFRFLMRTTGATDGVLVVRSYDPDREPAEDYRAYDVRGEPLSVELIPFPQSLASAVVSRQDACIVPDLAQATAALGVHLQPFEQNRRQLLAAPLLVGTGTHVVLELFDKRGPEGPAPFTDQDRRLIAAAADFGAEMLKQALAERQAHAMLLGAIDAALAASQQALATSTHTPAAGPDQPPPAPVLERLRASLEHSAVGVVEADQALRLAELVRVITLRHGREATAYCTQLLEGVDRLLRAVTGAGEEQA